MICQICNSADNVKFIDTYKLHIEYDKKYFKNLKIYRCSSCNFSFCHPMPDRKLIDNFYSNVYRSSGRPHEIVNISLNGISLNEVFLKDNESKKRFYTWRPNLFSLKLYIKEIIRFFTPDFIMKIYKSFITKDNNLNDYCLNVNDAWCVRAIFKVHK